MVGGMLKLNDTDYKYKLKIVKAVNDNSRGYIKIKYKPISKVFYSSLYYGIDMECKYNGNSMMLISELIDELHKIERENKLEEFIVNQINEDKELIQVYKRYF